MIETRSRMIFVNLPVRDLQRSMSFFTKLGFTFNKQFTDEKAACMILNEQAYVMLLVDSFFKSMTTREICDPERQTEGAFAISCTSREEVDAMVKAAGEAGAKVEAKPDDYGFMYQWGFTDLDGHHWDPLWMDPAHVQK